MHRSKTVCLFDQLIGPQQDRLWQFDADRFCGLQIDRQLKFRRLLDRQICRLFTFENFGHVICGFAKHPRKIGTVADKPAGFDVVLSDARAIIR